MSTLQQYQAVAQECRNLFEKKTRDYGSSWRVLRTISVVDQLFIKALRIRNLQSIAEQKVADDIRSEFVGIFNYALIGLIQWEKKQPAIEELDLPAALAAFDAAKQLAQQTMEEKNHDYGEAWRDMSQESFADLILVKLLRIKQILGNDGQTLVSEGIEANYTDIANYAAFALILIAEGKHKA
ncbi:MAG: DUF1599 domain-containing protein [Sphingobacteriia bacterium]|nr:MAG: DUF1599 domain-containing protein [Sphingobacteriia bacterium]